MGYNFVMYSNQYDSFSFRMVIDQKLSSQISADKLLANFKNKKQTLVTK